MATKKKTEKKSFWNIWLENPWIHWPLALILIITAGLIMAYPAWRDLLPLGDDPARHLAKIASVGQEGFLRNFLKNPDYPPFFHFLVGWTAEVFQLNTILIIKYVGHLLPFLTLFALFAVTRQLGKKSLALVVLLIAITAGLQPYRAYIDGNYPEILARGVVLPFLILYLAKALSSTEKRTLNYGLTAFLGLLIFSTHYLSFALLLLALILALPSLDRIKIHFWLLIVLGTFAYIFFAQFIAPPIKIIEVLRLNSPPLNLWEGILRWPLEVGPTLFYSGLVSTFILFLSLVLRPFNSLNSLEQKAAYLFLGLLLADLILYTIVSAEVGSRFLRNTAYTFPYIIILALTAVFSWPQKHLKIAAIEILAVLILWALLNPYFLPGSRYAFGALPNGFRGAALRAENKSIEKFRLATTNVSADETLYINNFNEYAFYLVPLKLKVFESGDIPRFMLIGPKANAEPTFFYSNYDGLTNQMLSLTSCTLPPPPAEYLLADRQINACYYY